MEKLKFSYNGFAALFVGVICLFLIINGNLIFNVCVIFLYLFMSKNSLKSIVFDENKVIVKRHLYFWQPYLEINYRDIYKVTTCSSNRLLAPVFSIYTNKGRHQFFLPKEDKKKLIAFLSEKQYYKSKESDASNEIFVRIKSIKKIKNVK
jgi:hypothetical protein